MDVRFLVSGDTAVVVEFGDRIDRELSERVLRLSRLVRASNMPGVVETVPTYRSLMVHYDPLRTDSASLIAGIENLIDSSAAAGQEAKLWRIPACYAASHAPDLAEVAERAGLSPEEVVRLHAGTCLHVYMVGFVPGFPYMGDLPEPLVLPRRTDPRIKVPAGSIATAAGHDRDLSGRKSGRVAPDRRDADTPLRCALEAPGVAEPRRQSAFRSGQRFRIRHDRCGGRGRYV